MGLNKAPSQAMTNTTAVPACSVCDLCLFSVLGSLIANQAETDILPPSTWHENVWGKVLDVCPALGEEAHSSRGRAPLSGDHEEASCGEGASDNHLPLAMT